MGFLLYLKYYNIYNYIDFLSSSDRIYTCEEENKIMKNLKWVVLIGVLCVVLVILGLYMANKNSRLNNESLETLMTEVYAGIPEEQLPMGLANTVVTEENVEYFLGTSDVEYEEALASEPMMSSIAHSVVLVRAKKGADIEAIKTAIKENVNPRKWLCVGVEEDEVIVKNRGNLIILIMNSAIGTTIEENFDNL